MPIERVDLWLSWRSARLVDLIYRPRDVARLVDLVYRPCDGYNARPVNLMPIERVDLWLS